MTPSIVCMLKHKKAAFVMSALEDWARSKVKRWYGKIGSLSADNIVKNLVVSSQMEKLDRLI